MMLEKCRRVMPVVGSLNSKYGRGTIRWAVARPGGRWRTRSERSSPHYTTKLSDVPILYQGTPTARWLERTIDISQIRGAKAGPLL